MRLSITRVRLHPVTVVGLLAAALGLKEDDGRLATVGLLSWILVLSAVLVLPPVSLDIFGSEASNWAHKLPLFCGLIWLLVARYLSKTQDRAWPAALLSASLPFIPLLVLWPLKDTSLWQSDYDVRLYTFSLAASLALGLVAYRVWPGKLHAFNQNWPGVVVVVAATYYVALFSLKSLVMFNGFHLPGYDISVFDQALWNGARWFGSGEPLPRLMSTSLCCDSILADHAFVMYLALLPVYAVGLGGPVFLLMTQSIASALAAVAVFLLGRDRLGNLSAALVSLAYLAFFVNQRGSAFDFRIDAFVAPLLLFALYAFSCRRIGLFFLLVVLALACKEDVPLVVMALGLYLILFERAHLIGTVTFVLAALWFAVDALLLMPFFGGSPVRFTGYYDAFGDTPIHVVSNILRQPSRLTPYFSNPIRIKYLLFLLVPLGFVPLLGAPVLLVALPRLALNLLSIWPGHHTLVAWYEYTITPFIFAGAIYGLQRLGRWSGKRRKAVVRSGGVFVLSGCLFSTLFWGPRPIREINQLKSTDHDRLGHAIFELIPPQASVATQWNFSTHLAHRQQLWVLPEIENADYILLDIFHPSRGPEPEIFDQILRTAFIHPDYGLDFYRNGYFLFKRGGDPTQNLRSVALVTDPDIQNPMRITLHDKIVFLGFDLSQPTATSGEPVYLATYWQSLRPVSHPYQLFLAYPASVSGSDTAHGLYPVAHWRSGQIIRDEQMVRLPNLPDGDEYEIAIGLWYDEGELSLERPEQFLGHRVMRIATIEAKAGNYTFQPRTETLAEGHP